ncbi:MAG TPA: O-antigen ligase family protein [Thermoguttaceae bacterium]|nr:O-antigen ligase family protein [Thermoguttaceae bacterium]
MSRNQDSLKKTVKHTPGSGDRTPAPGETDRLARLLVEIVDIGLAGCIFVVPMLLGGRHALGRLALVALAVAVALAWSVRQCLCAQGAWRRSSAQWLLLAGVIVLAVQLVPLPPSVMDRLAPHTSEILPLWSSGGDSPASMGVWSQVSLTPAATRAALVTFLAYALLFLVTVQRIEGLEDVERLLRWCALSALVMAAFGVVQFLFSNGKFFWVYEHPYADTHRYATGAFANRNHFAHFLALGLGPVIWWVHQGFRKQRRSRPHEFGRLASRSQEGQLGTGFRVVGLAVVLFAVLLSLSRGGSLAALVATVVCLAVCYRTSAIGPKLAVSLGAAALLIGVSLSIFGHEGVSRRLGTLTAGSLDAVDGAGGRRTIWSTVAKAIPDYPLLGAGVGSHREVYPMYLERVNSWKYFSHAECGYLQVALESGFAGFALLITGIGLCGFWCISGLVAAPSNRMLVCVGVVSAGLAASAAHSLVDFVWYIPGCMVITAVLAACACRLGQMATKKPAGKARRFALPRPLGLVLVAGLAGAGAWMLGNRVGPVPAESHWDRFLLLNRDSEDPLAFGINQLDSPASEEEYRSSLAAKKKEVAELEEVVRWAPEHARAHLRLAEAYVRLFHQKQERSPNVMAVSQIRDAVLSSRSESVPPERRLDSREKLEQWLSAAIGDHYRDLDLALMHTRRALSQCPLLGEGYLLLGELCFLDGGRELAKSACVDQALRVRPFDGTVLLHAGSEAILSGDLDRGLAYWRDSFRRGTVYQEQIIDWLVGRVHPWDFQQEIGFFLETFQPDLEGLRLLERRYRQIAGPEQMVALRRAYVEAVEVKGGSCDGPEGADLWLEAMLLYQRLDDPARRLQCGRNALECDPNAFQAHQSLADCLADLDQFAEAKEHLEWCLRRDPADERLLKRKEEIVRKEILGQHRTGSVRDQAEPRRTAGTCADDPRGPRQAQRLLPRQEVSPESIRTY